MIALVKDIVTLFVVVIGALMALFVYFQFAPVLSLRIVPTWIDDQKELLLVRFEIENRAHVRVYHPKGRIQILEYGIPSGGSLPQLSPWVPFVESAILPSEQPLQWREPEEIFKTTQQIYPGEMIMLERLYHVVSDAVILHIGLQVEMKLSLLGRIITCKKENWRQTTTCFVVKH